MIANRIIGRSIFLVILISTPCSGQPDANSERLLSNQELLSELSSFSLRFSAEYARLLNSLDQSSSDLDTRSEILRRKYSVVLDAVSISASTSNPDIALLDMLVLIGLELRTVSERWGPASFPNEVSMVTAGLEQAYAEITEIAERVFDKDELAMVQNLIEEWLEEHPDATDVAFVRFSEFDKTRQVSSEETSRRRGFTASLRKTTETMDQTLEMLERQSIYLQALPILLNWQSELLFYTILDTPEVQDSLGDLSESTKSLARLADTAEGLQELIAEEREALVSIMDERISEHRDIALEEIRAMIREERQVALTDAEEAGERLIASALEQTKEIIQEEREIAFSEAEDTGIRFMNRFFIWIIPLGILWSLAFVVLQSRFAAQRKE